MKRLYLIIIAASFLEIGSGKVWGQPVSGVITPPPPPPPAIQGGPLTSSVPITAAPISGAPINAAPAQPPVVRTPAPQFPTGIKAEEKTGPKLKNSDFINLDFVNADIAEVTKSISELTKRNFILDDQVHGKITIISPKPVTVEEAYQAFISALAVKNFTVVQAGRMYKVVPLRDMKQNPIPTDIDHPMGGDDAFVTKLIPIRYTSAQEIVKALRGLLTKNGDVVAYDLTNTLIITDAVGNLRRLVKIVDRLDTRGDQESIEVIKLKYASAVDVSQKVMQIFDLKDQRPPVPGTPDSQGSSQFISKLIPDDRTNSIVVMANQEGIRRVREVVQTFDRALEVESEKGRIHVHYLQYADASELVGTLSSLTGGGGASGKKGRSGSSGSGSTSNYNKRNSNNMFPTVPGQPPMPQNPMSQAGGGGSANLEGVALFDGDVHMTADVPTNSLVITASPADFRSLLPVIHKLDIRRPQCFVEAMIIEVDIDKAFDVGAAVHGAKQSADGNNTLFGASQLGGLSSLALPTDPTALQGLAVGLTGRTIDIPVAGGKNLSIPVYGALFHALQANGTINILSTPNIMTSDNKEAEIVVGQVVPFVVASGRDINNQPINQIQRENVAITLRVTPQINESDDVTMDIFQEIQDLVPGTDANTNGPTTSNRSAKTVVLVKDSQTITVGGLIADRDSTSISKVPILGDIPIIGWFFKNKTRQKRKTSLVIFITPHIIRNPEDMEEMSVAKNLERQRFLKENNVEDHSGLKKYQMDKSLKVPKKLEDSSQENFLPPVSAVTPVPVPAEPTQPPAVPTEVPTPSGPPLDLPKVEPTP